ncbi:hypothetical protein DFH06DRAFT_1151992 [Mycena polygramma]|nr:hypothetical protein DFH06DRAFT_1151992 [Mycena polygramma]
MPGTAPLSAAHPAAGCTRAPFAIQSRTCTPSRSTAELARRRPQQALFRLWLSARRSTSLALILYPRVPHIVTLVPERSIVRARTTFLHTLACARHARRDSSPHTWPRTGVSSPHAPALAHTPSPLAHAPAIPKQRTHAPSRPCQHFRLHTAESAHDAFPHPLADPLSNGSAHAPLGEDEDVSSTARWTGGRVDTRDGNAKKGEKGDKPTEKAWRKCTLRQLDRIPAVAVFAGTRLWVLACDGLPRGPLLPQRAMEGQTSKTWRAESCRARRVPCPASSSFTGKRLKRTHGRWNERETYTSSGVASHWRLESPKESPLFFKYLLAFQRLQPPRRHQSSLGAGINVVDLGVSKASSRSGQ